MLTEIILPQLGDTMDQATITRWFKREGDAVKKGEPLFEVLTDKANIEVEATTTGFLRRVLQAENVTVPVGQVIAYMTTRVDEPFAVDANSPASASSVPPPPLSHPAPPPDPGAQAYATARRKPFVSPRARRVAKEFGVDVAQLVPASKTGRVMEADVRRFLAQGAVSSAPTPAGASPHFVSPPPQAAPAGATRDDSGSTEVARIEGVRKVIFDRMSASAREIARVTLTTEADATGLVALREQVNARQSEMRFSFTDFFVFLVARALLKYPYMNATLREDGVHRHAFVNLGVAADTERGLLVPVVRDAHRKGLGEIYAEVRRLSEAARTGKIAPDDLRGGTFTITNLGAQEIDAFTPIVNQPEIAILGIGRIALKPAAHQGQLALRSMVSLSLSFDHRVVDGAPAGKFLQHVKHLIETPGLALI